MSTITLAAEVQARIDALVAPQPAQVILQSAVDATGLGLDLTNLIAVHTAATDAITGATPANDVTALNAASIALGVTSKGGGGGSISQFPQLPLPLKDDGFINSVGNTIPHKGTLIDNVDVAFAFGTAGTGGFSGKLGGSTIWTVNPTDFNAACDGFAASGMSWYDSINDRLYMFAVDATTTPDRIYTGYITLETGAVTNLGSLTPSGVFGNLVPSELAGGCVHRPNIDSGNFTLLFNDKSIVIDESTGLEVSASPDDNVSDSAALVGTYTTLDGTITLAQLQQSGNSVASIVLSRNKLSAYVPIPVQNLLGTQTANQLYVVGWGDKVKLFDPSTNNGAPILRTFDRVEFDEWLQLVADYGGLA